MGIFKRETIPVKIDCKFCSSLLVCQDIKQTGISAEFRLTSCQFNCFKQMTAAINVKEGHELNTHYFIIFDL